MLGDTRSRAVLTWVAVQADRVWRLLPDVWRLLTGSARTLRWLIAPAWARPGVALIEGEAMARPGTISVYHMRIHNPTAAPESLRVFVRGWSDHGGAPAFSVTWHATLAPYGSADRWLRTSWSGDATLLDGPPRDASLPWTPSEPQGRWIVEASLAQKRSRDWVRIGGTLVR
jgi:hypothetical protein